MSGKLLLNGSDYLMLGFDHELRRHGYAGNSCQIILELGSTFPRERLDQRIQELCRRRPIVQARPGGMVRPSWKLARTPPPPPRVRVHREAAGLEDRLFNERLESHRGELLRFDLIEKSESACRLMFTWAHALMDAPSAEYVLAFLGREDLQIPAEPAVFRAPPPSSKLTARLKLAWKTLYRIDKMGANAPRSLGVRYPSAAPALSYRVERFSAEESKKVRENAVRICGLLGAAQFHAAAAIAELHRLHTRLAKAGPSYVLPVPVGLRLKGAVEPLFSNQVTMLMTQFLPDDASTVEKAAALLKTEMQGAVRSALLESGRVLSELFRFLPRSLYMAVLKKGLSGEICSLFYGDTAAVNPNLTTFLGAPILDFVHVAAITPSPGIGVIFYSFQGNLRVTILHLLPILSAAEAGEFSGNLRRRLLEPSAIA
jgi:hypothetical protein